MKKKKKKKNERNSLLSCQYFVDKVTFWLLYTYKPMPVHTDAGIDNQ